MNGIQHNLHTSILQEMQKAITETMIQTEIHGPLREIRGYRVTGYGPCYPLNVDQPLYEGIQMIILERETKETKKLESTINNIQTITTNNPSESLTCSICLDTLVIDEDAAVAVWYV